MIIERRTQKRESSDLPYIEYADIIPNIGRLNKDIFSRKNTKHGIYFQKNDILFGKLRPYLNNWLKPQFEGIAVGDFWILNGIKLNNDFLYYYIQTKKFSDVANVTTGTKMPRADWNLVSNLKIKFPNFEEQQNIGKLLYSLEKLITLYERKKELLKKFQQGFSDILFKKNPKECVSLGDYFYFNKGKNIGNKDLINNGKYYAIVYGELYTTYNYVISKVFSKTSIKGFKGRKNDLLFPSSSTVPFGTATCSALEIDNIELGNDIIVARPKNTNELDSAFISYQINSKRKILYPIISGTTITHMYSKDLSKIRIWLPNITTQNYISNILQRISHLNILVDKKVNILKEIKKEFLNTMFI